MKKLFISILLLCIFISTGVYAKENFFDEARNKYDENALDDSKFLFQRNIVFNPKHAKSYLFLAKIYNSEENEQEEIKYLKTTLLLEPENEEALYMLIDIELKKSNYSEVKKLTKNFEIICSTFCDKTKSINERLKNIEPKDESKQ